MKVVSKSPSKSNQPVAEALKQALASTYALYLKTQNYHWNVESADFYGLHKLFEGQYEELSAAIDEIAEFIRAQDVKAPGSFAEFQKLSAVKDGNSDLGDKAMLKDLVQSHDALIKNLEKAHEVAEKAEDHVTGDFIIARITAHRKHRWMLKSSLG